MVNRHNWNVFVRLVDNNLDINKYVRKVTFELDETFGTVFNDCKVAPFELGRIGWGTFNIPISIYFRRETGQD